MSDPTAESTVQPEDSQASGLADGSIVAALSGSSADASLSPEADTLDDLSEAEQAPPDNFEPTLQAAIQSMVVAFEADVLALAAVLDDEAEAARIGASERLKQGFQRKLELAREVETGEAALQALLAELPAEWRAAGLTAAQRASLSKARAALRRAVARNDAALRAASEAIRRIFEGAARAMAAEDIGYGPSRLRGDGHLFRHRTA